MQYFTATAAFILLLANSSLLRAQETHNLLGRCQDNSHYAEGFSETNLAKSNFYCDSASLTFSPDGQNILFRFFLSNSVHSPIFSFQGSVLPDQMHTTVDKAWFPDGSEVVPNVGVCQVFFAGKEISGLFCFASSDVRGIRSVMNVAFDAFPNQ